MQATVMARKKTPTRTDTIISRGALSDAFAVFPPMLVRLAVTGMLRTETKRVENEILLHKGKCTWARF